MYSSDGKHKFCFCFRKIQMCIWKMLKYFVLGKNKFCTFLDLNTCENGKVLKS